MEKDGKKILKKLVSFNTIKDKENKNIIEYIKSEVESLGFTVSYEGKSLICEYGKDFKLGFLSHTDTVEVNKEAWDTDPFILKEKDNMLYGLGACDTKSTLAAFLEAVSKIDLKKLKKGIKIYITYDEEISFKGAYEVIENEKSFPEYIIVGEPTNNMIDTACKGILEIKVEFEGRRTHASTPNKGINSNVNAIKFFNEINKYYEENIKADKEELFPVAETTFSLTKIEGGDIKNAIPDKTIMLIDSRISKKEHLDMLKMKLEEIAKKYNGDVSYGDCLYPFNNDIDFLDEKHASSFITEASLIDAKNRIILGAGPVTAHEINEHISIESFDRLVSQYEKLIKNICEN